MKKGYSKALNMEYLTVGYSVLEAVLAIIAGVMSGSIALLGFGLDSVAESISGIVLIWRIKRQSTISSQKEEDEVEKKAIKLVGISFIILGFYVFYETIKMIILFSIPDPSLLGIIIAIFGIIFMPVISYIKYNLGDNLGLDSLKADAKETLVCSLLSFALLAGLIANYFFGFWFVDPIVSFLIVGFLLKEGFELIGD